MLGKLFRKKSSTAAKTGSRARTVDAPEDLIDEDETIVIDLTSETHPRPEDIRLSLEEDHPVGAAQGETVSPPATTPAPPAGPDAGEDTEIWTGEGPGANAADARQQASRSAKPIVREVGDERLTVGWLVVTSDNGRGVSYPVRPGRNKLGRAETNAICVELGDSAISKDGHLTIAADPKSRRFYAIPGDSTNLVYLNEEPLLEAQEIADKAILQVGQTSFVFVQFAGNYVDWE